MIPLAAHLSFPDPSHQQALTWVYVAAAAMRQALFLQPAPSTQRSCFSIAIAGPPFCRNEEQGTLQVHSAAPLTRLPWPLTHDPLGLGPLSHRHHTDLILFVLDTNVKSKYSTHKKVPRVVAD